MTLFRPVGIGPLVAWAMDTMPADASHALAQAWWPAAMGVLQKSAHWRQTLEALPRARSRAPGPRWNMVDAVARVGRDLDPPRDGHSGRFDVLSASSRSLSSGDVRRATEWFDALRADPVLAAEADLWAGYFEVRRRGWKAATARFARVDGATADPFLVATASYLAGWSHEQLNQSSQAIAAYERALAFEPEMRNVATLLAAQLFLSDRRDEAHPILERALGSTRQPADLVTTLEHGDARFVAGHLDAMRRALR
jgi:tetratricopeptide (TPR) repeat protein